MNIESGATSNFTSNDINLLKQIAANLGVDDIKQGSYLNTLVRGLLNINEKTLTDVNTKINNINIDTADEDSLESFGSKRNLPRFKNNEVSILARERFLTLKADFYEYEADKNIKLFETGDIVFSDIFIITFIEDVWFNTNLKEVYVSCNISVLDEVSIMKYLTSGTNLDVTVPIGYKNKIRSLSIDTHRDLYFSNFKESLEVYRARLKHSLYSSNISNSNSIEVLLNRIPYVSQYYIDESTSPFKIYILNDEMYFNKDVEEALESQSMPYAEGILDSYRGYSSSFEFKLAERISYGINIEIVGSLDTTLLEGFRNYLVNDHRLGDYYSLGRSQIEDAMNKLGITNTFTYKFYYSYNGVQFEVPNSTLLEFEPKEFPYLESLTINGEAINVST